MMLFLIVEKDGKLKDGARNFWAAAEQVNEYTLSVCAFS